MRHLLKSPAGSRTDFRARFEGIHRRARERLKQADRGDLESAKELNEMDAGYFCGAGGSGRAGGAWPPQIRQMFPREAGPAET
jgi:hypothetical protein